MESKKDSLSSCVRIVCRIRKPLESESGSKHLGKARTSGKVGLNPEFEYSVFTTSKESNLVLASETPVPGKLINATFKASTDLPTFVSNFDKKPTTFTFDYVAGDYVSQEGFYNQQVRGLVQSMIKGYSATILAYGPTGSGKTYSLRGKTETERGCIVRSVQDLFSLIELAKEGKSDKKYSVGISIYHLYGEKIVDLLDSGAKKESLDVELIPESDSCERQIKGLSEYPLKSAMAINGYLERSDTLKKMQASEEQDKELSLKSHTSVLLKLYVSTKNDKQLLSQIQFIELAGSEQINLRHTLRKPLSEHFANLSIKLLKHSLGEIPESRDQLQKCLDLTMKPQAPVVLLCCVEPRREKLDQSIEALAYTTKIRTCILSAMARDSLGETASKWDKEILTEKDKEYVEHVKAATRNPFKEPKLSQTYGNVEIPRKEELSYTARGYDRSLIANKSSPEEARFEEDLKRIKRQVAEREREDAESFRGNGTIEPEQRYVERSSPEFLHSKREMAATLGEDARRIVDKYYGSGRSDEDEEEDEKVVEDYSKSLKKENDGVELKKKLVKIEEKSKTIAKSLKALLRGSGQAQTMQQFDSIYEETKGIYEEYIANLEDRVQRLEVGLEGTEKALQEKDQQYNDYVRNAKKKLKEKDLELADLLNQAESLENVANEAKNEVETCKNENEALIAEINSLKKKEIEKQEGSKKHKEIERLNNEVAELKQAFKEKKKENAKNKSTIRDMNKEITMLKQELADQTQQAKEAAEESRILKKQVEQEKQFSEEIKRKLEKAQSRKNKYKDEIKGYVAETESLKTKVHRLENDLYNAEEKSSQHLKETLSQLEGTKIEKAKLEEQCELLKTQLEESHSSYEVLQEENTRLSTLLKQKGNELDATIQELNDKYKTANATSLELHAQYEQNVGRIQELEKEIERMKKEKKWLEEEKDELASKCKELKSENKKMKNEVNSVNIQSETKMNLLEDKYEDLLHENERLKSKVEQLSDNEDELRNKISIIEKARDSYKDQYMNAKKLNKDLRKKLDSIEQDVQLFIKQREMELYENQRRENEERYKEASRIEALRDVKGKINKFKTERIMKVSPHISFTHMDN